MIPAVCSMGGLHLHIDFISCHKAFPLEIWKCREMSRNPIHFIIMRQLCGVVCHDNYIFDGYEPTYIIYMLQRQNFESLNVTILFPCPFNSFFW
jgi:hypothetical protein